MCLGFKLALLPVIAAGSLLADFSYQQSTEITGGAMASMMKFAGAFSREAREPMVSQIYIKGHRLARIGKHSGEIFDLDKETVTQINFDHKTYSVQTFEQMRQQIESAMNRAKTEKSGTEDAKFDAKVSVKSTGQSKTVEGFSAKEALITVTVQSTDPRSGQSGSMDVVTDNWLAEVPGSEESKELYRLMGEKLGTIMGPSIAGLQQRPELMKGMGDSMREMAKLGGMPIETITRMGATGQTPADGSQSATPPAASSNDETSTRMAAMKALSGFGGFGRKKKEDQSANSSSGAGGSQSSGSLIEMTTRSTNFSSASIDSAKLEAPAGFKQVDPADMGHHSR